MPVKLLPSLMRPTPRSGQVNVRYARWCREHGLNSPDDFVNLQGEVITGHRDRHVLEVRVNGKKLFLKKEHRVSLGTRLRNWWDGYGTVSLSEREAATLTQLREAGVPVPEWIACGASSSGQAFVLLRNARGIDLRTVLTRRSNGFSRWRLTKSIGVAIGRLHQAGFDAPDLSAKHVLVRRDGSIVLIDWPRAFECRTLNRDRCLAALAGMHASVLPDLATMRERLSVLKSWMHTLGFHGPAAPLARQVIRLSATLSNRRSIREQLQPTRDPRLRWIAGEALCVTSQYWQRTNGLIPSWLRAAATGMVQRQSTVSHAPNTQLTCFPQVPRHRRWLASVMNRPLQSDGIRLAGLAFRLARHGVPVMPILAFGGRRDGGGFLLSHISESVRKARAWLALPRPGRCSMLRRVGSLLRRCHEAGCRGVTADHLMIEMAGRPRLRLNPNSELFASGSPTESAVAADLSCVARGLGLTNRPDVARIIRGYFAADNIKRTSRHVAATSPRITARRAA